MSRESAFNKGRRYLVEGRLQVVAVSSTTISATVRGDSAEVYSVGYAPGGWHCDCPAKTACAHVVALQLVTLRPRRLAPAGAA